MYRMANKWVTYKNGDYRVYFNLEDGTKVRTNNKEAFHPDTIESMDLKITNKCSGTNCSFCHEGSSPLGKHGDIMNLKFLDNIGPWREISIGGGNALEHPDLVPFLKKCKVRNLICNLTVNQIHLEQNYDFVKTLSSEGLVKGIGISLASPTGLLIKMAQSLPGAVIHLINGLISEEALRALKHKGVRILVLGYKQVRRGKALYEANPHPIEEKRKMFSKLLPQIIKEGWYDVISFDNLAIKQLGVKNILTEEEWNRFYMGDDGLEGEGTSASMYVDAVERKFAKNSCAPLDERYPLMDTVEEMYQFLYPRK